MLRTPLLSPRSGLTSRGTLWLALAGAGTAVFLLFLFPRMTNSRAAEPRGKSHSAGPLDVAPPTQGAAVQPELLMVPPILHGADGADAAEVESGPPGTQGSLDASLASTAPADSLAAEDTGPKLTYAKRKGQGKVETIKPGEFQAAARKAQRERAIEEALARGEPAPPARTRAPNANPKLKGQGNGEKGAEKRGPETIPPNGKKSGRSFDRKKNR